jgi:hypothetical protein
MNVYVIILEQFCQCRTELLLGSVSDNEGLKLEDIRYVSEYRTARKR